MKNCRIINFKKIGNNDIGFLIALEGNREIPFDIKRIYYIYNVPKEIKRGFHAHKRLEQVLICMSGSIKIKADNGNEKKIIELNSPNKGLYIGPGVWHEMCDFSQNSVLLVLASDYYNEKDYIRDYEKYLEEIRRNKMTIYNSIIINPAEYLKPAYRISPFSEKNIISNHFLDECNTVDLYLKNKFKNKEFIYTENGRNAISIALSKLNLSSLDEITILTTTNNFYISSC